MVNTTQKKIFHNVMMMKMSDAYLGCKERKLNFLSGQSCMTTVGCKKCIDKYKKNLYSLKGVIHDDYLKTKTCEVNSNNIIKLKFFVLIY